jgi:hypothetical protein
MGQAEFLTRLGFTENPFQFTNADEEEHLQTYFIPPPYFGSVWGDPQRPSSHVIFAPRGGGKSAQRRMIEYRAQSENVFAVTYDRFEKLDAVDLHTIGLDFHLRNIIELILLGFLLEYKGRELQAPSFSSPQREQIESLCGQYLGKINRLEALDALKSLRTLSSRAKQALREWSGPVNALVSAALASHGVHSPGLGPGIQMGQSSSAGEAPSKIHLEIAIGLLKSIGFDSVYILVDKVDETPKTGNDAEDSFLLIKPLLRDLELMQLRDVGFKFFLWDKLQPAYREYARPDRLQQFELSWSKDDINKMLSRRLEAFSEGRIKDLSQLTSANLATGLQVMVTIFASGSPRDMIRICQQIMSEQLQMDPDSEKIGVLAIIDGISKFSQARARELVPPQILRDLIKVGRLDFTTNYVANDVFKISVNSARNKILQWTQTGAVERVGELHTGSRPVHHYAISDIRVGVAMLPQVDLMNVVTVKLQYCTKCLVPLLRDWDVNPSQTCHQCGKELTVHPPPSTAS